jgi:hypothetical protein
MATSMSLEERTKTSLEDAAQTRLGLPWHHVPPFDLVHVVFYNLSSPGSTSFSLPSALPSRAHDRVTRIFRSNSL